MDGWLDRLMNGDSAVKQSENGLQFCIYRRKSFAGNNKINNKMHCVCKSDLQLSELSFIAIDHEKSLFNAQSTHHLNQAIVPVSSASSYSSAVKRLKSLPSPLYHHLGDYYAYYYSWNYIEVAAEEFFTT